MTDEQKAAARERMAHARAARKPKDAQPKPNGGTLLSTAPGKVLMANTPDTHRLTPTRGEVEQMSDTVLVLRRAGLLREFTDEQALAVMLKGWELDLKPIQATEGLYISGDGQLTMRADLMRSLVQRSGVGLIVPVESSTERATVKAIRYGVHSRPHDEVLLTYTIEDAERAGLLSNPMWQTQRRACLFSRASSEAARSMFSDVLRGVCYTPEELGAAEPAKPIEPVVPPKSRKSEPVAVVEPEPPGGAGEAPVGRALTHSFNVTTPQGLMKVIRTAGVTHPTLKDIIDRTTARAGYPNWQQAQDYARGALTSLGIAKLEELTEPEGLGLILELQQHGESWLGLETVATPVSAKPDPGTGYMTRLSAIALKNDIPLPKVVEAICVAHNVAELSMLDMPTLGAAVGQLEYLAKDPAAFALMLDRSMG